MEDRNVGQAKQGYGECRSELLQARHEHIAERHHEQEESQGKGDGFRDLAAKQGEGQADDHADQRYMFEQLDLAGAADQPKEC